MGGISNYDLVQLGISTALTDLGIGTYSLADMMTMLDSDGNQIITLEDFKRIMERDQEYEAESPDEVQQTFQMFFRFFDQDGNDQISSVELSEALTKLGESPEDGDIDFILAVADEDNDGQLNFEEFLQLMLPEEVDTGYSEPNNQWFHDQLAFA